MSATVAELLPGQQVTLPSPFGGQTGTFIAHTQHPIWLNLRLVIWKINDGHGSWWSHDALDARQEVGEPLPSTPEQRLANLRAALLGERGRR